MSEPTCLACGHDHGSPPPNVFMFPPGSCLFLVPFDGLSYRVTVDHNGVNTYAKEGDLVECHCPERIDRIVSTCCRERHHPLTPAPHEQFAVGALCAECLESDAADRARYETAHAEAEPLWREFTARLDEIGKRVGYRPYFHDENDQD